MEEKIKLETTLKEIDKIIENAHNDKEMISKQLEELKAYLQQNVYQIADDEMLKIYSQTDTLFSSVERELSLIKKLEQIKPSPYFGKVTYAEEGDENEAYIGLADVISNNGQCLISDWRAPISSLFYDSKLGKSTYFVQNNPVDVELKSKKQISIKKGKLIYAYETNEKIDDEILLNVLKNQKSSETMKNIVSSIQVEQNEIIRQPSFFSIIINGVAGSGKTSIAMHRLAYLLYSEKDTIKNENILILSPNELFSNYLSTLLPELGEDNAETISFRMLMLETFSKLLGAETRAEMLEDIFVNNKARLSSVQEKFFPTYAEELMDFLSEISIEDEIDHLYLPGKKIELKALNKKYSLTKENRFRIYRKIEYILDEILFEHFNRISEDKQQEVRTELKAQIEEKLVAKNIFERFLSEKLGIKLKQNEKFAYDLIPTYAFINFSLFGFNSKPQYKAVFIDEIQDYDALSLKIIKELLPNAKFIIVGDVNQNLIGKKSNLEYLRELLKFSKNYELSTCYRSTIEITNLANALIDYSHEGKIVRHGDNVKLHNVKDKIQKIKEICENEDSETKIAIICKTQKEAKEFSQFFPDFGLITSESMKAEEIEKTRIITTIHLSKGLEFDCTILPNISEKDFASEQEIQLLYVMLTRALHKAHLILGINEKSIFLNEKFKEYLDFV